MMHFLLFPVECSMIAKCSEEFVCKAKVGDMFGWVQAPWGRRRSYGAFSLGFVSS